MEQLYKNLEFVRAPNKEVVHKLQVFIELLHCGVYEAEFMEQSQTPRYLDILHEKYLGNR